MSWDSWNFYYVAIIVTTQNTQKHAIEKLNKSKLETN
jgi:hypothetical protein